MAQLFRKSAIERLSSPQMLDKSIVIASPLSFLVLIALAIIMGVFFLWAFFGTLPSIVSATGIVSNATGANSICSEYGGFVEKIYVSEGDEVKKGEKIAKIADRSGKEYDIYAHEDFVVTEITIGDKMKVNPSDRLMRVSPVSDNDDFIVLYVDIENIAKIKVGMEAVVNIAGYENKSYGHATAEVVNVDMFATDEESIRLIMGNDSLISYITRDKMPLYAVTCKVKKDENSLNKWQWTNKKGETIVINKGSVAQVKIITSNDAPITRLIPTAFKGAQ